MAEYLPTLPDDPWTSVVIVALVTLIGWGGRGFIIQLVENRHTQLDKAQEHANNLISRSLEYSAKINDDLREELERHRSETAEHIAKLTVESTEDRERHHLEMEEMREQMDKYQRQNDRLNYALSHANSYVSEVGKQMALYESRVIQLEAILSEHGVDVPPWTILPTLQPYRPVELVPLDDIRHEGGATR